MFCVFCKLKSTLTATQKPSQDQANANTVRFLVQYIIYIEYRTNVRYN
jgi:hypothetical protein